MSVALAIVAVCGVWLLVTAGVLVLCRAAKRADADLRSPHGVPADVVPLVVARRQQAQQRTLRTAEPR